MLFFRRRVERVLNLKKIEEQHRTEEKEPLEKGDLTAMLIAAFLVFLPAVLLLIGVVYLLLWLFIR